MKIYILELARNDLKEIHAYLSCFGDNPARKLRESFENLCNNIQKMPMMYNEHKYNTKYRCATIEFGYLVFYQADEERGAVRIYRVLHGKRNTEHIIESE